MSPLVSLLFLTLVLILELCRPASCFPTGPRVDACEDSMPNHGDLELLNAPPYTLTLSINSSLYTPNEAIGVTVSAQSGYSFRGFFLSAFAVSRGVRLGRVGTWANAADESTPFRNTVCGANSPYRDYSGQANIHITHSEPSDKTQFKAVWTPPLRFDMGDIEIQATLVNSPVNGIQQYTFYRLPNVRLALAGAPTAPTIPRPALQESFTATSSPTNSNSNYFLVSWPAVNNGSSALQFYTVNVTQATGSGAPLTQLFTVTQLASPALNFTGSLPGAQFLTHPSKKRGRHADSSSEDTSHVSSSAIDPLIAMRITYETKESQLRERIRSLEVERTFLASELERMRGELESQSNQLAHHPNNMFAAAAAAAGSFVMAQPVQMAQARVAYAVPANIIPNVRHH